MRRRDNIRCIMRMREKINLIFFEDYRFSPEFEMMKRYEGRDDIYVRFSMTPMSNQVMRAHTKKQMFGDVMHNDPTGVYAFPLDFVLKNYNDLSKNIFFGGGGDAFNYVYILQDTSKNKFVLNREITFAEAGDILAKMFNDNKIMYKMQREHIIRLYKRIFMKLGRGVNINAQMRGLQMRSSKKMNNVLFFMITQLKKSFIDGENVDTQSIDNFVVDGDIQRARWLKAGYDALLDLGGVIAPQIGDGEKEQIVFLTEDSFKIVDEKSKGSQVKAVNIGYYKDVDGAELGDKRIATITKNEQRNVYFARRLVADMLKILGDKVTKISLDEKDVKEFAFYGNFPSKYQWDNDQNMVSSRMEERVKQGVVGFGKRFIVFVGARYQKGYDSVKMKWEPEKDFSIFDFGVYTADKSKTLQRFSLSSLKFKSYEDLVKEVQKNIEYLKTGDHPHFFSAEGPGGIK